MADRNPILKPVTDPGVQFAPDVQQQAIYDASLSGGGVAALDNIKKGKVVSYTSSTRTGTVTIDGANVPFRDATLRLLIAGDNIALARLYNDAQDWVCVGVLSPDSGSGLAPNIGVATISTGFPINTNAIPFPINPPFGSFSNTTSFPFTALAYDMNNALGYGSDCIIGFPSGGASVNLLSRTTGTATSLYTAPTGLGDAVNFLSLIHI